ncbi:GGDEF domain-containing protein [Planomonospora sp. ID67723]|uniref:putative bifunctional diguanylate cyclase/phosphodiesterase n=1 Tax=Planomonospora sp. ID67723 TaxID=2738134 RepID=UPI0018C3D6A4|nr:bifunctional diguanylate cyclase/phosphodiesterase [Planomonospora sp. ID67723]MBG0830143.1 GGDEF domain-containing protein [Planomonospora sp. ID67723]
MNRVASAVLVSAPSPRICHPRSWLVYLLAGGLLVVVASFSLGLSPVTDVLAWALVQGATTVAVAIAIRRHGLTRSWPWRLIGGAVAVSGLAVTLAWGIGWIGLGIGFFLDLYNVSIVVAYGLSLSALIMLNMRAPGARSTALLDAGIITVGVAMPMWSLFIDPALDHSAHTGVDLAFHLIIPVLDLFTVGLAMRLALDNGRAPWLVLLGASFLALFFADGAYLLDVAAGRPYDSLSMAGWLGWSVLVGSAVLHPSAAGAARLRAPVVSSRARVTVFLALALLSPLISGLGQMLAGPAGAGNLHDGMVIIAFTVLLAVLLILRLAIVARLAEEHAADLGAALYRQEILRRSLSHNALHDPLTGLANRTLLGEALQHSITVGAATPGACPPALLLLDLDGFKDVNDTFGHPIGDALITQAATRLQAVIGDGRLLARLGGDEFAVILPGAGADEALALARRILSVMQAPYRVDGLQLHVTTSIGVLAGLAVATPSQALRDADLALYAAKNAGKNQITLFTQELRQARLQRVQLTDGLRQALAGGELTLEYQPVVDLASGDIHKVEALLRWRPPGERPVPPDVFIPIAEETGLIVAIGRWALEQAVADARRWHTRYGVTVTVNVSGRQLREENFSDLVLDILARHGLPARALILEITESMLLATTPAETIRIIACLTRLREHGVRIALDDFGTGYSSLSYLRTLPVDILKIDKSFVPASGHTDHQQMLAFVKAIVELSASLGLSTVAEGVETREQAVLLQQLGCPMAQGYLFSPPATAHQIDGLLHTAPWRQAA